MKALLNLSMIGRQVTAATAWDKKPIPLNEKSRFEATIR